MPVSLDLQTTPTASDQDARIELYSSSNGTCSGTLTKRGCDTDGPGTGGAQVTYTSASTTTYFVRITDFACNENVSYSLALSFDILADDDKTINIDCDATYNFYDSGGPGGDGTGLYGNNQNNDVTFVAPAGQSVRLTFKNVWRGSAGYCSTGNGYNAIRIDNGQTASPDCSVGDYLTIYDGAAGSNIVGVYTGTTAFYPSPGTIISSGNTLTVNFTSGSSGVEEGWEAVVECVSDITENPTDITINCGLGTTFTDDALNAGGQYQHTTQRPICGDILPRYTRLLRLCWCFKRYSNP